MARFIIFGVHAHQPWGNFDDVIEWAYENSYKPFLDITTRYKGIKVVFHLSGALLEWISKNHADFIDKLAELIERQDAEIVASGFYEPVLASIPEEDAIGQLVLFSEEIEKLFGITPKGVWLTERVWEPGVAALISKAGFDYVFVDDYHFLCAGLTDDTLDGYYYTECGGKKITVFPISQKLRYYIPFKLIPDVKDALDEYKEVAVIVDDYEKFGVWPGTYKWVYEEGWLLKFYDFLLKGETKTILPSNYIKSFDSKGLVYLPTVSYFEMSEWSLPAESAIKFRRFMLYLQKNNLLDEYKQFVRGGIWKGFFAKYPESNYIHKKMYLVSRFVREVKGPKKDLAKRHLYRGQCNDAYWHGIFGGLYLPHLRRVLFIELNKAQKLALDNKDILLYEDFNMDGKREFYISNADICMCIYPHKGASLRELSFYDFDGINTVDVLARRREHYHVDVSKEFNDLEQHQQSQSDTESVSTIHEKTTVFSDLNLQYDDEECLFAMDKAVLSDGNEILLYKKPYIVNKVESNKVSFLCNVGVLDVSFSFLKEIMWYNKKVSISYRFLDVPKDLTAFKLFLHLILPSCDGPAVYVEINGKKLSLSSEWQYRTKAFSMVDSFNKYGVSILFNDSVFVSHMPIKTASQSELGAEYIYQGSRFEVSFVPKDLHYFEITLSGVLL